MPWIDLTPDLTKKGQQRLKVGQVLIFDFEGTPLHLKIMRKFKGKIWAKRVELLTPEGFRDKYANEAFISEGVEKKK